MITRRDHIKCDKCGHFISYQNLADGKATHVLIEPDSLFGSERYESECKNCIAAMQNNCEVEA